MAVAVAQNRIGRDLNINPTFIVHGDGGRHDGDPQDLVVQFDEVRRLLNNGRAAGAKQIIDRLKAQHESRFTRHLWFRYFSYVADLHRAAGEFQESARLLLRAKDLAPSPEDGALQETLSYLALNDIDKARELATQLYESYPNSPRGLSLYIQLASPELTTDDLATKVPNALLGHVEVATSLAGRALRQRDLPSAIRFARGAAATEADWFYPKFLFAQIVLQAAIERERDDSASVLESGDVERAKDIFRRTIEAATEPPQAEEAVWNRLYYAMCCELLGDEDSVSAVLPSLSATRTNNPELALGIALLLRDRAQNDSAIRVLEGCESRTMRADHALAELLAYRNGDGDRLRAIQLLEQPRPATADENPGEIVRRVSLLADLLFAMSRIPDVRNLIASPAASILPAPLRDLFLARCDLYGGNRESATELAILSFANRQQLDWPPDRQMLVGVLSDLGHEQKALQFLKETVGIDSPDRERRAAVHLAIKLRDDEFVLDFCARLRAKSVYQIDYLQAEIGILRQLSLIRAVETARNILAAVPDGFLKRFARMLASLVGLDAREPELVERQAHLLPTVAELPVEYGAWNVRALLHCDTPIAAFDFAYELFRREPDDFASYEAVISSFLEGVLRRIGVPAIDVAAPGAAVKLREQNGTEPYWVILEASDTVKASLDEISSKSELAQKLVGMQAGDAIDIRQSFGPARNLVVEEVLDKRAYRCRSCLDALPSRFPHKRLLDQIPCPKREDGSVDFAEFIAFLHHQESRKQQAIDAYRRHERTLNLLGMEIGHGAVNAVATISNVADLSILCCGGAFEERAAAIKGLGASEKVVIDDSALAVLFTLYDAFELPVERLLSAIPAQKYISENTLKLLVDLHEQIDPDRERLGGRLSGGKVVPEITAAGTYSRSHRNLGAFIDLVRSTFVVLPGSVPRDIEADVRDSLNVFCGRGTVEALSFAVANDAVLWADDALVVSALTQVKSFKRAWTQATLLWLGERDPAYQTEADDFTLGLLRLKLDFTALTVSAALSAARRSRWIVTSEPLRTVMEQFGHPTTQFPTIAPIAGQLLKAVWLEPAAAMQAEQLTWRLVDRLSKAPDGWKHVLSLLNEVDRLMGLHVVAAEGVKRIVRTWISVNQAPKIIVPG